MPKTTVREQIRYHRNDIAIVFKKKSLWINRLQPAKILNISKQGIAICSNQALKTNNRIEITLSFREGQRFLLNGQVVHAFDSASDDVFVELHVGNPSVPLPFKYGIRFERQDLPFRDYLIESGCRNGFEVQQQGFYQRLARL
ncbi:MAG: PilZ domain-containing protein [Methylobacter sp.]